MSTKTQELTFGAMIVAVFGVLLLVNRQTGGMLGGFFMFLFPIPMVAFSAKYGFKDSIPVFVCTALIAFFFGTFTGIFYAVAESFIGMVYGSCIKADKDMNRTLILVMILSAAAELLCTIALASFAGFDLNKDILAMQESMNLMFEQAGIDTSSGILSFDYLRRMYIITTGFVGAMEGLIVYYLSYQILKKLRYPIRKPQPLTSYYPSKISGVIAFLLSFAYTYSLANPFADDMVQNIVQSAGMCGVIYLIFFGYIACLMICSVYFHLPKIVGVIITLFLTMSVSYILMLAGFIYISGNLHYALEDRMSK